jgi:hypothetical protein
LFASKLTSSILVFLAGVSMAGCAGSVIGSGTNRSGGALAFLKITPTEINFGNAVTGTTAQQGVNIFNSGTGTAELRAVTATGEGFEVRGISLPLSIGPGASANFVVVFSPVTMGSASGSLSISSTAQDSVIAMKLEGTGTGKASLEVTPSSAQLGSVPVGSFASQAMEVEASGAAKVTIQKMIVEGSFFSISGPALPQTLAPGQSLGLTAEFRPSVTGSQSGAISIISDAPDSPLQVPLSGTGIKATIALSANPAALTFGSIKDGTSVTRQIVLKSTGNAKAEILGASIVGAGFAVSGSGHDIFLDPGQTLSLTVTFHPSQSGNAQGTLDVETNAPNSPLSIPLSGAGSSTATAVHHSVDLTWTASSSSSVIGYDVYRGANAAGPFSRLNAAVNASTSYTDSSVASGQTYYYVVTAVDSANVESSFSAPASVSIP